MSLVTLEEAQGRVGDAITQDQIDEVEEQLARLIGPLTGERTETFPLDERNDFRLIDGLYLSRYTDAVILTHDGDAMTAGTDYRLIGGYLIDRISTSHTWTLPMVATYSPNDEESVRSAIYDWLTYSQTPTGIQAIRIGAYSETYFPEGQSNESGDPVIGGFLRRILPAAGLGLTSPYRYAGTSRARTVIVGTGS
jgi:hypothetical protein